MAMNLVNMALKYNRAFFPAPLLVYIIA